MFLLAFSIQTVQHWVATRGFWGGVGIVFALLFACGLGLPLPEDIPLIIAGALLVHDPHTWIVVGIACWCGIIGGDCVLYSLGRRYGMGITRVPYIGKHVTVQRLEYVQKLFHQYGVGVVGVGRLFAGIRGAMVITAGTLRFNFIKFLIADGLAAIVSGGFFLLVGHWIGQNLDEHKIKRFKHLFIFGGIGLALIALAWILWKRRHPAKHEAMVEKVVDRVIEKVPHREGTPPTL